MQDSKQHYSYADATVEALNAPVNHAETKAEAKERKKSELRELRHDSGVFNGTLTWIRRYTPNFVVNSGSQFNFAFKAAADTMSIWSSVRKGSASPARLVASLTTLGSELLGMVYKEKRITEKQDQYYDSLSKPGYIVEKIKEGLNPKDHILETVGLATIANGIFTTVSGILQSSKKRTSWETFQGMMTVAAGLCMSFIRDRERAWQWSTAMFWTRAPVAGKQAWDAYYHGFPDKNVAAGDWQQAAKWGLNQTSNVFGFLYGGVKKLPDGTIVHIGKEGGDTEPRKKGRSLFEKNTADSSSVSYSKPTGESLPDYKVSSVESRRLFIDEQQKEHAAPISATI